MEEKEKKGRERRKNKRKSEKKKKKETGKTIEKTTKCRPINSPHQFQDARADRLG